MQVESELHRSPRNGASVIRAALNRGVAARAVADKVFQRVRRLVILEGELAPRCNVVHVHRPAQLGLCRAALLACVVVTLAGFVLLTLPVGTPPFDPTALPVVVVVEFVPFGGASVGAKTALALALYPVSASAGGLAAALAGKQGMFVGVATLATAILRRRFAGFVYGEDGVAAGTRFLYRSGYGPHADVATKTVLAVVVGKRLAACFAGEYSLGRLRGSQRLAPLARAPGWLHTAGAFPLSKPIIPGEA